MRRGTRSVVSWIKRRPIAGAPTAKATVAAVREAYLAQRVRGAPDRDRGAEGGDGHARAGAVCVRVWRRWEEER